MGKYLNHSSLGPTMKAEKLVREFGAEVVRIYDLPKTVEELLAMDKALVCVVENMVFDAAILVDNKVDFEEVLGLSEWHKSHPDGRPKTFLYMDKKVVETLIRDLI